MTLRDLIQGFEVGVWSRHWRIADDVRGAAAAQVLADVRARGLDLDTVHTIRAHIDIVTGVV
ncbi:MAG TPA: hypothetical protein VMM13_14115 [Euzebya sp.]|nr:hypothetical protein [Euzebya sp.]